MNGDGLSGRLNRLRAGVLGANDGIVSTAGLVVGVAGATTATGAILTAGVAGVVAGAVSMALGEYVSVSSQRDTEKSLLARERAELEQFPDEELAELAGMYWPSPAPSVPRSAARPAGPPSSGSWWAAHWPWPSPTGSACSSGPPGVSRGAPRRGRTGGDRSRR